MNYKEKEEKLMELYKKRDEIQMEIEKIKRDPSNPSCFSCVFLKLGKCSLNGLIPPENIANNGCECFQPDNDYIPF